jgi:hypothetical protein
MDWIFKLIEPIIKDCNSPEEAEAAVEKWGKLQHPRDAFCGLMAVWIINADWDTFKQKHNQ